MAIFYPRDGGKSRVRVKLDIIPKYLEGTNGTGISKPAGGTLQITFSFGYRNEDDKDDMKDKFGDTVMKGVITYDGLDLIISSMESIDKIASEEAKKGTPIYIVQSD